MIFTSRKIIFRHSPPMAQAAHPPWSCWAQPSSCSRCWSMWLRSSVSGRRSKCRSPSPQRARERPGNPGNAQEELGSKVPEVCFLESWSSNLFMDVNGENPWIFISVNRIALARWTRCRAGILDLEISGHVHLIQQGKVHVPNQSKNSRKTCKHLQTSADISRHLQTLS